MTTDYPAPTNMHFQGLSSLGNDMAAVKAIDAQGRDFARESRFDDVLRALARRGWVNSILAWMRAHQAGDIDARCMLSGRTALQEAVANAKIKAVETLLGMGANPLATDNQGFTSVHDACWSCRNESGNDPGAMLFVITACAASAARQGAHIHTWSEDDPNRPWTYAAPHLHIAMRDAWYAGFMDEKTPQAEACGAEVLRRF